MTEQTDLAPDETADRPDAAGAVQILRRDPTTVAEALDVHARLSVFEDWLGDRKRALRDWTKARAEARKREDGGAPTWRLDDGTVGLTDPQPTPRIADAEAFASWWIETVEEADPDADDAHDVREFSTALGTVVRRRTATAPSETLLAFLNRIADAALASSPEGAGEVYADAGGHLAEWIRVDVEWLLPADALDAAQKHPRVALTDDALVDRETGEEIPGTDVRPPGRRSVSFRPTAETKDRLRGELEETLGRPTLD